MRNANSQREDSMIPVRALHQLPTPHVSHAEIGGETRLRCYAASARLAAPKR